MRVNIILDVKASERSFVGLYRIRRYSDMLCATKYLDWQVKSEFTDKLVRLLLEIISLTVEIIRCANLVTTRRIFSLIALEF